MAVLDLHPDDRQALIDLVHAELLTARERTEASAAAERQFLRISATLIGSELDAATPDEASS